MANTVTCTRTFLLFSSLSLIADLDRADAENNRDDEKEDSTDYAGSYGLVLDARRHRILILIARAGAIRRIGVNYEIIRPAANQIFH